MCRSFLLLAAWLAAAPALAGAPSTDRRGLEIPAVRIDDAAIRVDGRLDEATWQLVPALPPMIQESPRFGAPPSLATDVRFAYGRRGIYVAFVCHGDPERIVAPFFTRDQITTSDRVWIEVDTNNDDTNGYMFSVTPSGAIADAQIFRDINEERLWDGVWSATAREHEGGWSAEIFVPWSTLRFPQAEEHTFGINAGRVINEGDEVDRLSFPPQGIPGRMSRALHWVNIRGVSPGLNFELRPFASTRFTLERPHDSLDRTFPVLPNAGFDAKYGLRGNLTLDVAVNPDFGQAEVDAAVLNLLPFEVYFPEKRQFFLESKEIFETHFNLFYSRRIGRAPRPADARTTERTVHGQPEEGELVGLDPSTRIADAVRITGELAPGWTIGVLTALTTPSRGVERFSDGDESPVAVDPMTQWSVVRLRRHFDSLNWVGGMVTNVTRFDGSPNAFTGGVDYNAVFRRRWQDRAQVIATHDGERSGMGAWNEISRTGKNTDVRLSGDTLSPHVNFGDLGFYTRRNFITGSAGGGVYNAQPVGRVRRLRAGADLRVSDSYAAQPTERHLMTRYELETLGLWSFETYVGGHLPQLDLFETRGGIPYEVPFHWWTGFNAWTPRNRRVSAGLGGNYGEQNGKPGPDARFSIGVRPLDRLQMSLETELEASWGRPRWVATDPANADPIFGAASIVETSGVFRSTLGITGRLSITTYNQLLYSTAHHTAFFVLEDPRSLVPTAPDPWRGLVDQALTSLVSNTILRWEYVPGSFIFVAYTHRSVFSENGMTVKWSGEKMFTNLARKDSPSENILFLKLVHLFGF
jgi:hypothetical protein